MKLAKSAKYLTFYSPSTGFVTDRKAFPHRPLSRPDTELYTISDQRPSGPTLDVYEYEVPHIRVGEASRTAAQLLPRTHVARAAWR